jgi:hypothetical protein
LRWRSPARACRANERNGAGGRERGLAGCSLKHGNTERGIHEIGARNAPLCQQASGVVEDDGSVDPGGAVRIGWVGGLDRSKALFEEVAQRAGHTLEMHEGHVGGRGSTILEGVVARCDVLVIVTELNSHGGVMHAKRLARRAGRRSVLVRKGSVTSLQRVIASLAGDTLRPCEAQKATGESCMLNAGRGAPGATP